MLTELAGSSTVAAPHLPPEVVDGADEAQLVAWAGNGCAAAIEQLVGRVLRQNSMRANNDPRPSRECLNEHRETERGVLR
jgi:hypothetical protein